MAARHVTLDRGGESPVASARMSGSEALLSDVLAEIRTPFSPLYGGTEELIALLRDTVSARVRAAVAMTLADLRATDAIGPLLDVLGRPELAKTSGTLVFALSELGASIPIDLAVSLIATGSFEARAGVLELMEEGRIVPFSEAEATSARRTLAQIGDGSDSEATESAELADDYIGRMAVVGA